jgi:hypothetical protein
MRARRHFGLVSLLLLAVSAVPGRSGAQGADAAQPLFADDRPLTLTLAAPFRELIRLKDRTEYDGTISIAGEVADVVLDMQIRVRGRRRLEHCDFPPLSIAFSPDDVAGTVFSGQQRLKLVTLCRRFDSYRDYLALEYLIYEFFNALTDRSFRVRWVDVQYVYTDTRRERSIVEHAFLVEDDDEVAERLGMQLIERQQLSVAELDPPHTALVSLFQFMIGNTDWALIEADGDEDCCHNGKVVAGHEAPFVVLPYDFDQSGLIDAEYAVPSEKLRIRSVTQRQYRGFCVFNSQLEAAVARLNEARASFGDDLVSGEIRERSLMRAVRYLDDSFEIINDAEELQEEVYEECRP